MPVLPKPINLLRATWQTARMARRLRQRSRAVPAQAETFSRLMEKIAVTTYGGDLGITADMNYAQFRARVPIRNHDQLEPYLRRIKRGEPNVLWPGHCIGHTETSGTTGPAKWLPVTADLRTHFERAAHDALLHYTARVGHARVFRGRQLFLAPALDYAPIVPPELSGRPPPEGTRNPFRVEAGWATKDSPDLVASPVRNPDVIPPTAELAQRALHQNITLLGGLPNWLLAFAANLRKCASTENKTVSSLREVWPDFECIVHHGIPIGPFQDELREAVGMSVAFHEIYFAAESFIAVQDGHSGAGLRLLGDNGVFFEFLPLADYNETLPLSLGAKAMSLQEVRVEEDYVLLVTTPAGLCRYVLGDIVRFVSLEPPRLLCVGRPRMRLSAFDENVIERDLTDALVTVCQNHNWKITNFHVAPLFNNTLTGGLRGRHEWWVELKPGTAETPTGPILANHLDEDLQARNSSYALKRKTTLEAPVVRLVMPGFFAHWMEKQGKTGGHQKMLRCRNDRMIADEFSALACFNAD